MAHELFHALGAVMECAANYDSNGNHVNDDPADLMYSGIGARRVGVTAIDVGTDDYYGHGIPGCWDTQDSPLWVDPPEG